jgi:hypothetical protein
MVLISNEQREEVLQCSYLFSPSSSLDTTPHHTPKSITHILNFLPTYIYMYIDPKSILKRSS